MTLSPQFLDELRQRTHLSGLIGRSVKLTKAGREHKGCCPFHQEKTPSFYVNDDKGFYHCFGCSAHGDAIRFLTDARGLPFIDAVKELAAAAGLAMPAPDPRAAEQAERQSGLAAANEAAAGWFADRLQAIEGADARAYLERRGIPPALAKAFGFGFAPDSRGKLKAALDRFGDDTLVEAGLLIRVEDKTPYDRFRGRLMIPIRDPRGRTIAFGGRILGTKDARGGEPKYLNSPDTPLFDKGRTLFNLDRAAPAARRAGRLIVVEGYMDVVALAKAGIDEVVAPNGTAVTEAQLERMWRLAEVPILCLDGDAAGQRAAVRAAHRALPMVAPGRSLAFAALPAGQDPDDLVRSGGRDAVEEVLAKPKRLIEVIYHAESAANDTSSPEGRAKLRYNLRRYADTVSDKFTSEEYKRAFNRRYDEDYGWKRDERRTIVEAVIRSGPRSAPRLFRSYMRSALYGLSRFPVVLAMTVELVGTIRLNDAELQPWRDSIVNAIIKRSYLNDDALQESLDVDNLKVSTRRDITVDLRFPWDIDPGQAIRTLSGMIEFVHDEQQILTQVGNIDRELRSVFNADEYAKIEAKRAELYAAKVALYQKGYELGGGEAPSSEV